MMCPFSEISISKGEWFPTCGNNPEGCVRYISKDNVVRADETEAHFMNGLI